MKRRSSISSRTARILSTLEQLWTRIGSDPGACVEVSRVVFPLRLGCSQISWREIHSAPAALFTLLSRTTHSPPPPTINQSFPPGRLAYRVLSNQQNLCMVFLQVQTLKDVQLTKAFLLSIEFSVLNTPQNTHTEKSLKSPKK